MGRVPGPNQGVQKTHVAVPPHTHGNQTGGQSALWIHFLVAARGTVTRLHYVCSNTYRMCRNVQCGLPSRVCCAASAQGFLAREQRPVPCDVLSHCSTAYMPVVSQQRSPCPPHSLPSPRLRSRPHLQVKGSQACVRHLQQGLHPQLHGATQGEGYGAQTVWEGGGLRFRPTKCRNAVIA